MHTIEVDFDVFKELTLRRESEKHSYNDVLRHLLKLPPNGTGRTDQKASSATAGDWICKGVRFPEGSEFRANYQGRFHYGKVKGGKLIVDGQSASSPSDAARLVTHNSVNGWTFWECRLPNDSRWRHINSLRSSE